MAKRIRRKRKKDETRMRHVLKEMVRKGDVTLGARNDPALYPGLPRLGKDGLATRLLDEERGER